MALTPMTIHIPEHDVADLRQRIQQARWPPAVAGSGWEAGTDAGYLRELADYWATRYDWRAREARLNRFEHLLAEVDGIAIHVVRAAGQGPSPLPHPRPGRLAGRAGELVHREVPALGGLPRGR